MNEQAVLGYDPALAALGRQVRRETTDTEGVPDKPPLYVKKGNLAPE